MTARPPYIDQEFVPEKKWFAFNDVQHSRK
jgi:hypothetical protein